MEYESLQCLVKFQLIFIFEDIHWFEISMNYLTSNLDTTSPLNFDYSIHEKNIGYKQI